MILFEETGGAVGRVMAQNPSAANMNGRQKLGIRKQAASGRFWVAAATVDEEGRSQPAA